MLSRRIYTLAFVKQNQEVLLGMKKRGFGQGRWNGFGGKLEPGETVAQAAARELNEESGLKVDSNLLAHLGRLEFQFVGEPELMQVEVFTVAGNHCSGTARETEEMSPRWFPRVELPFDKMWPDDRHWFRYMLEDKPFFGKFLFEGHDHILEFQLRDSSAEELANIHVAA